jgi:hypothetical protein
MTDNKRLHQRATPSRDKLFNERETLNGNLDFCADAAYHQPEGKVPDMGLKRSGWRPAKVSWSHRTGSSWHGRCAVHTVPAAAHRELPDGSAIRKTGRLDQRAVGSRQTESEYRLTYSPGFRVGAPLSSGSGLLYRGRTQKMSDDITGRDSYIIRKASWPQVAGDMPSAGSRLRMRISSAHASDRAIVPRQHWRDCVRGSV